MIKTVTKINYENVFSNYKVTYEDSEKVEFVPLDQDNTDYQAIIEWAKEDSNEIAAAD